MNIEDVTACPHCGSTFGYYRREYAFGWIRDNTLYETDEQGRRQKYNPEMYDDLRLSRQSKYYYCMECDKKICKA